MSMPEALQNLAARALRELDTMAYPAAPWVDGVTAPDGSEALDCAIIGAGQFGLTIAAGLRREQVKRVMCFDAAAEGAEGPWVTYARMGMLRTPKDLTGPDLGIPSLSFRAFWEAQHGEAGWDEMFRVPRTAWMDYLNWYRATLGLPVRNLWRLTSLKPGRAMLELRFDTPGGERVIFARSVVLATGAAAGRSITIPEAAQALPPGRALSAYDPLDCAALKGERLGILGGSATAFDLAIAALQAGATSATLCLRRPSLPYANPRRWMENAGFLAHYIDLPDATKWAYSHRLNKIGQSPPKPTFDLAMSLPGFAIRTSSPWDEVSWNGTEVVVRGGGRTQHFDRVAYATGMRAALEEVPAFAAIAEHAARWEDRYTPPRALESPGMARNPYLNRYAAFQERTPCTAPWLGRIMSVMGGGGLSLGPVATSVSGMKYLVPLVLAGVKRQLFLDQQEADWARFTADIHAEIPKEAAAA
jgi:cation diffusion facilitator CzcD-associated flavoprotein CzcO